MVRSGSGTASQPASTQQTERVGGPKAMRVDRWLLACLSLGLLSGCATTVNLRVLEPADVMVPPHIQTVAVLDRSRAGTTGQGALGVLEAALTGEALGADREGRAEAMRGVTETLTASPRFRVVQPMVTPQQAQTDLFGAELSWPAAARICAQAGCQGIVSLEVFDSDSAVTDTPKQEEYTDDQGKKHIKRFHEAQRQTRASAGWRFYDVSNKAVIDQLMDSDAARTWSEQGQTFEEAAMKLPSQINTVRELGRSLGSVYARRVAPSYVMVSRKLYDKGDERLKTGGVHVKAQDWPGAAAIWEGMLKDPDPQVRGKAEYNLALAMEMRGDLDGALVMAKQAAIDLDAKRAHEYVSTLQYRIAARARLQQQMQAPKPADVPKPPPAKRR